MERIRDTFLHVAFAECESYIKSLSDLEIVDYDTDDCYPAEEEILDTAWKQCNFIFE